MTHLCLPSSTLKPSTSLSSIIKQTEFDFLPSLKNFSNQEIPKLRKRIAFFLNSLKSGDSLFSSLRVQIKKTSLEILEKHFELDHELFLFFLKYILQLSRFEGNNHKIHVLALEVDYFKISKKMKFSFIFGLENICDNLIDLENIETLVYLLKIDGRWIFIILPLKNQNAYYLIDFVPNGEGSLENHDFHNLMQKLHYNLFQKKIIGKLLKLDSLTVHELTDSTIFASFILYNLLMINWRDIPKDIGSFSEGEMRGFSNKILWLIYTIIIRNDSKVLSSNSNINIKTINETLNKNVDISQNSQRINESAAAPLINEKPKTNVRRKSVVIEDQNDVSRYCFPREILITQLKNFKNEIIQEVTHKKSKSNVEAFISEELDQNRTSSTMRISKKELGGLLGKYHRKFIENNNPQRNYLNNETAAFIEREKMENYQKFHNLLWFYYYYDKAAYQTLIEEYNKRLQNHLLTGLGLPPAQNFENEKPKKRIEIKNEHSFSPQYNLTIKSPEIGKFVKRRSIMKKNSIFGSSELITKTETSQPSRDILAKATRNSIKYDNLPIKSLEKLKSERNSIKNSEIILNPNVKSDIGRLSIIKPGSGLHFTQTDQKILKLLTKNEFDVKNNLNPNENHTKTKSYLELSNILTKKPEENRNFALKNNDFLKTNEKSNNSNNSLSESSKMQVSQEDPKKKISIFARRGLNFPVSERIEPKIFIKSPNGSVL